MILSNVFFFFTQTEDKKAADNVRDDAKDDKGVKKDKDDVEKDSGEKDTEASDKKNSSAVSKSPRSKPANKKNNDDATAAKKADSGEKRDDGKDCKGGKDGKDEKEGKDGKNAKDGKDGKDVKDGKDDKDGKDGKDGKVEANENADDKQPNGIPLGDIAKIEKYITSTRIEVLQTLHQICFDAVGKTNLLKKSLRQFAGFDFDKDDDEYEKKLKETQKFELPKLKSVCEGLQLDKKGSKEAVSQRICEFLLAPTGSEDTVEEEEDGEEEEGELPLEGNTVFSLFLLKNVVSIHRRRRGRSRRRGRTAI